MMPSTQTTALLYMDGVYDTPSRAVAALPFLTLRFTRTRLLPNSWVVEQMGGHLTLRLYELRWPA